MDFNALNCFEMCFKWQDLLVFNENKNSLSDYVVKTKNTTCVTVLPTQQENLFNFVLVSWSSPLFVNMEKLQKPETRGRRVAAIMY